MQTPSIFTKYKGFNIEVTVEFLEHIGPFEYKRKEYGSIMWSLGAPYPGWLLTKITMGKCVLALLNAMSFEELVILDKVQITFQLFWGYKGRIGNTPRTTLEIHMENVAEELQTQKEVAAEMFSEYLAEVVERNNARGT